jgi:hypothetical protein
MTAATWVGSAPDESLAWVPGGTSDFYVVAQLAVHPIAASTNRRSLDVRKLREDGNQVFPPPWLWTPRVGRPGRWPNRSQGRAISVFWNSSTRLRVRFMLLRTTLTSLRSPRRRLLARHREFRIQARSRPLAHPIRSSSRRTAPNAVWRGAAIRRRLPRPATGRHRGD